VSPPSACSLRQSMLAVVFLLVSILAEEPESGLNAGNWGNDRAGL
jgi:hypothetical protein